VLSIQNTQLLNQLVMPSFLSIQKYVPKNIFIIPGWTNIKKPYWGGALGVSDIKLALKSMTATHIKFYNSNNFKLLGQFDNYDTYKMFYELNFILKNKNNFSLENLEKLKYFFNTQTIKKKYSYKNPNRESSLVKREEEKLLPKHR